MKAYKVLLSVVLCLAMALGMVGACAEPASGKWTLRNVNITTYDEVIAIGPEASLSASLEEDALKLHIEALNGGNVLVPVSAEINQEGLLFSLDDSGRVYSLDYDTVFSMMGMTQEDMQVFELIGRVVEWIRMLVEYQPTGDELAALEAMADGFYSAITGSAAEAVQVEIDGQSYAANSYKGAMTLNNAIAALDFMRTGDVQIMAEYAQMILDIFNMASGSQAESYADWARLSMGTDDVEMTTEAAAEIEAMMNEVVADVEIISGQGEDYSITRMTMGMDDGYSAASVTMDMFGTTEKADMSLTMDISEDGSSIAAVKMDMAATADAMNMTMDMNADEYGAVSTMKMEAAATADTTTMTMRVEESDPDYGYSDVFTADFSADAAAAALTVKQNSAYGEGYATDTIVTCNMTLAEGAVTGFDADMNYDSGYSFTEEDGNVNSMSTGITLAADGAKADGLWNMTMDMDMSNEYSYGPEGEAEVYADTVAIDGSYAETAEADGSTTAAIAVSAAAAGESYALSFEINAADGAILPDLAGEDADMYALTENTEDLAYTLLYADAMGLAADAMELAADEGIARLVTMFTSAAAEYADDAYDSYDEYAGSSETEGEEYYYDDAAADYEYVEVADLAEAADVYAGTLPAFTVPAGYAPDGIYATAGDVDAYFASGDKAFNLYVADYGVDLGTDGPIYTEDAEAGCTYVEYVSGPTYVLFIFGLEDYDQAEMESIIAGLSM